MVELLFNIVAGILSIFLAEKFVAGVNFYGNYESLVIIGAVLGILNFFVKPVLNFITLPLRILTLGLFGFVINMILVWVVVGLIFPQAIQISGIVPLFITTLILVIISFVLGLYPKYKK